LVDKINESVRVCLIVSDDVGYELVTAMIDGAFAHNKSIQNIIIVPNGKEGAGALKDKLDAHNEKAGIKGTLSVITAVVA